MLPNVVHFVKYYFAHFPLLIDAEIMIIKNLTDIEQKPTPRSKTEVPLGRFGGEHGVQSREFKLVIFA